MADENFDLRILGVEPGEEIARARKLTIRTTRGPIPVVMHAAGSASRAILCVSGAIGGFDGPCDALSAPRARSAAQGIAVAASTIGCPTISTNACSIRSRR